MQPSNHWRGTHVNADIEHILFLMNGAHMLQVYVYFITWKIQTKFQSDFRENKCVISKKNHLLYLFLINRIKFCIIIF